MDPGTDYAEEGMLARVPHKNQFGEWFVVVTVVQEAMHPRNYEYYLERFDVRILKERVKIR